MAMQGCSISHGGRISCITTLLIVALLIHLQFRKTNDPVVRAYAMARLHQQHTDPEVISHDIAVNKAARRGSRKGYISRDQRRQEQGMMNRWAALSALENTNLVIDLVGVV